MREFYNIPTHQLFDLFSNEQSFNSIKLNYLHLRIMSVHLKKLQFAMNRNCMSISVFGNSPE